MEKTWLDAFQGQRITVLSGQDDRSDTGTLIKIGDGWVQMAKDNGEMILVPSSAIRIVKLLEMTQGFPAINADIVPPVDTRIYEPNAQRI